MLLDETIAAPATLMNASAAIGIIRITGDKSADILIKIMADKGAAPLFGGRAEIKPRYMHHGFVMDPGGAPEAVDEAMVCFYRGPASYTGEDMAEIFCHGGSYNMSKVLGAVLKAGARAAAPGEFTKRACVNGKLDLCQAEAVCDIINSKTDSFHKVAVSQIKGSLSFEINSIKNELIAVLADIEANLDFPEEDVEPVDIAAIRETLLGCRRKALALLSSYEYGRVLKDGIKITIAGCPNVGKSSLFNLLLRENRAIVTEIPGTTRDVIEEAANIGGVAFTLADTAGVRAPADIVEKLGIDRTFENIRGADLCLLVIDAGRAVSAEDIELIAETNDSARVIAVNKIDAKSRAFSVNCLPLKDGEKPVEISVKENANIDALKAAILKTAGLASMGESYGAAGRAVITSARHAAALKNSLASFDDAVETIDANSPIDLLTIDIRAALASLGEIVGETVTDDILHKIFEKFCIGK
ncbi:MAG: tRNA uridine-5-carboxymethylaminomethyl(34) synthesis GTPase MnmE [Candidatus Wallbacteria bacterium GWC2_49_35]|uniref:tRNA modification GTPase MnmE n=1 Tax=Candidatus Wallbacteria bacterium GWC2_49_35 TaxID=1817813 RepID=A0A1F7WL49_9BACT|nr:MAG: tRNA uridine-5-carboxymethylaminomethyl(34) synthesis GTPase MnmE [Candidatus Wallbacteria bacterium GWC2_49_35]